MFSQRHPVLFISKGFIEPGQVTVAQELRFEGGAAVPYTLSTLREALEQIPGIAHRPVRLVLSEELVYVAALSFPQKTKLTREVVRVRAEETIPEDLRTTEWDFRTMRYMKHSETAESVSVQVAVIEHSFAQALEAVLQESTFSVASILPESYVLASFEKDAEGVTVIVEQDREGVLLIAALGGFVLLTSVKPGLLSDEAVVERFLSFVEEKGEKVARVIGSHLEDAALLASLQGKGYTCLEQSYNPLLGVFSEKISGRDENVLNLNVFSERSAHSWWQRFFRKKAAKKEVEA